MLQSQHSMQARVTQSCDNIYVNIIIILLNFQQQQINDADTSASIKWHKDTLTKHCF